MRAVLAGAMLLFTSSFVAAAPAPVSEHRPGAFDNVHARVHVQLHRGAFDNVHAFDNARVHVPLHRVASAYYQVQLPHRSRVYVSAGPDTRPAQWCGWFMRQMLGVADRAYNRALSWATWGHSAGGPRVGAVVVWRHHVGMIEGGPDKNGRWLVRSGNDGHTVRTRYLSLAGAVAFRVR
jgi:hypothetical protein